MPGLALAAAHHQPHTLLHLPPLLSSSFSSKLKSAVCARMAGWLGSAATKPWRAGMLAWQLHNNFCTTLAGGDSSPAGVAGIGGLGGGGERPAGWRWSFGCKPLQGQCGVQQAVDGSCPTGVGGAIGALPFWQLSSWGWLVGGPLAFFALWQVAYFLVVQLIFRCAGRRAVCFRGLGAGC